MLFKNTSLLGGDIHEMKPNSFVGAGLTGGESQVKVKKRKEKKKEKVYDFIYNLKKMEFESGFIFIDFLDVMAHDQLRGGEQGYLLEMMK